MTKKCDMCGYEKGPEPSKWCKLTCKNTMCIYPGPKPSCDIIAYGGFTNTTEAEKKKFLKAHNDLRQKVASGNETDLPAAKKPMPDLKWDDDMAEIAQRWATQCGIGPRHDTDGRYTTKFHHTGQNGYAVAQSYPIEFNKHYQPSDIVSRAVGSWYNEVKNFKAAKCDHLKYGECELPLNGTVIGHFTPLVWQDTTHVGCGYTYFKDEEGTYRGVVYCNYGPPGNYGGSVIWQ